MNDEPERMPAPIKLGKAPLEPTPSPETPLEQALQAEPTEFEAQVMDTLIKITDALVTLKSELFNVENNIKKDILSFREHLDLRSKAGKF